MFRWQLLHKLTLRCGDSMSVAGHTHASGYVICWHGVVRIRDPGFDDLKMPTIVLRRVIGKRRGDGRF
jgi:hypothetical protein